MTALTQITTQTRRLGRPVDDSALRERGFDWTLITREADFPPIDPAEYAVGQATLRDLIALSTALGAQAHLVDSAWIDGALEELLEARDMARAYRQYVSEQAEIKLRGPRNEITSLVALHQRTLAQFAEVPAAALAVEAEELRRHVFGAVGDLRALSTTTLWSQVEHARVALEQRPELQARLAVFVPVAATARLFAVHEELGKALGMTAWKPLPPMLDGPTMSSFLRGRITRYTLTVLVVEGQTLEGRQRLMGALAPLKGFRTEKRRSRKVGVVEEEAGPGA